MYQNSTPSGLLDYIIHFHWVIPTVIKITPFSGLKKAKSPKDLNLMALALPIPKCQA